MKSIFKIVPIIGLTALLVSAFAQAPGKVAVKCLIQMVNYTGEGAYVVVSLINPEGAYEETLYVQGQDKEWYSDITEWWKFYGKRRLDIDAISGATIGGGERTVSIIQVPKDKIDQGYSIRFETAVEDQEYYVEDVQIPLTTENLKTKKEGKGFIRYVRTMSN
ncbi:DUF2271 domain-containing protein [Spongiimicrobium salis]|uniref:DUF2271 domain-containing protein n=1 Tax=Spongiimicrobium salis TaxID=1667022 RepID=UPI00374D20A1